MYSEILKETFELKDKILNSAEYKTLKEKENKMMNDKECILLLNKFERAKEEYNNAKRFENYGSDVVSAQKLLSSVKTELDNNELVKEYNEAFKHMKKIIKNIEGAIFEGIIKSKTAIDL